LFPFLACRYVADYVRRAVLGSRDMGRQKKSNSVDTL
jgi:hypothetical protein